MYMQLISVSVLMVLCLLLKVFLARALSDPAPECSCHQEPSLDLGLGNDGDIITVELSGSHIELHGNALLSQQCLGYDGNGAAIGLPCRALDDGLEWVVDPFGNKTILNRASMQCLTAQNTTIVLASCTDPPTHQTWEITPEGQLRTVSSGEEFFVTKVESSYKNGACWINKTLEFPGPGQPVPGYANLGVLGASFGGDITISAEFNMGSSGKGQEWARVLDLGNPSDGGKTGNNILLARDFDSNLLAYQVYGTQQTPTPPALVSKNPIPDYQWTRVVIVQKNSVASMYLGNVSAGLRLEAVGSVNIPANVQRTHNLIGKSNWEADSLVSAMLA